MPTVAGTAARIHREGQPVVFVRLGSAGMTLQGFVRGYRADELQGNVQQGDREVRIAGVDLAGTPAPRRNDQVLIDGRTTTVQSCETRKLRGADAMHIVQVRG